VIKFALRCEPEGHGFDGWFRSSEDFERQIGLGLVACPSCGTVAVGKSLMRPAVATRQGPSEAEAVAIMSKLQEIGREVRAKGEYVGPAFAEEARKIHYGEATSRQIFGEASLPDVKGLAEEGIAVMPLPPLPEDKN
jgi:hypothetical protein